MLAISYTAFAVIATVVNLGAQRVVLAWFEGKLALPVAIVLGTILGLVVKYILDKRWIFKDKGQGIAVHGQQFGLYSLMGVATTVIFWGFEYGFWVLWQTDFMREIGAIIGLTIGYVTKYNLDRRFVFTSSDKLNSSGA